MICTSYYFNFYSTYFLLLSLFSTSSSFFNFKSNEPLKLVPLNCELQNSFNRVPLKKIVSKHASRIIEPISGIDSNKAYYDYNEDREQELMVKLGISSGDNYFTRTHKILQPLIRIPFKRPFKTFDTSNHSSVEVNIYKDVKELMELGFRRRVNRELNRELYVDDDDKNYRLYDILLNPAMKVTQNQLLKNKVGGKAKNIENLVSKNFLSKLHNYIKSLVIMPKLKNSINCLAIGLLVSLMIGISKELTGALQLFVFGNFISFFLLLTRNIPAAKQEPGFSRPTLEMWSPICIITALGIASGCSIGIFGAMFGVLTPFHIRSSRKLKMSFMVSLTVTSYILSFFEVYEEYSKNGWRWRKSNKEKMNIESEVPLSKFMTLYNPDTDEYTYEDAKRKSNKINVTYSLSSREIAPMPNQLNDLNQTAARHTGVKKQNHLSWVQPWMIERMESDYERESVSKTVKLYDGPFGFRDKRPEWLTNIFGSGLKLEGELKRLSREYGVYRKSQYKNDHDIILRPSDGVKLEDQEIGEEGNALDMRTSDTSDLEDGDVLDVEDGDVSDVEDGDGLDVEDNEFNDDDE